MAELIGDFQRHGFTWRSPLCESKGSADAGHMGIERNNQCTGRNGFPQAGVNCVFSDHPAEEEVKAFACGIVGAGEKRVGGERKFTKKTFNGGFDGFHCGLPVNGQCVFERTVAFQNRLKCLEQGMEVGGGGETVGAVGPIGFFECSVDDCACRVGAEAVQDSGEDGAELANAAEGESGGKKCRDFPIEGGAVAIEELDRVGCAEAGVIEMGVDFFEKGVKTQTRRKGCHAGEDIGGARWVLHHSSAVSKIRRLRGMRAGFRLKLDSKAVRKPALESPATRSQASAASMTVLAALTAPDWPASSVAGTSTLRTW